MNRNLLVFSLLMIVLGVSFNFYLISVIGVLLFFPALLSSRRRQQPVPPPSRPEVRRMAPPKPVNLEASTGPQQPMSQSAFYVPPQAPGGSQNYSPALFPTSMFPSLSLMSGTTPQPVQETPQGKPAERDELIEVGAIFALMKLAFG